MHYFAAVVVAPDTTRANAAERVDPIMAPYDEELEVERCTENGETYWHNPRGKWDWWVVGGRWTAVWVPDYKPTTDPANYEQCFLCHGCGRRPDADQFEIHNPGWIEWSGGCNGCDGTGRSLKYPPKWRPVEQDVIPVARLLDDPTLQRPFAVVIPDGGFHERSTWNGDTFDENPEDEWTEYIAKLLAPCREYALVVVDYHN